MLPKDKISGFTIIELLIVVALIAVMASFAVIRFTGPPAKARDSRRQSDIKQYQNSLELYSSRSNNLYPIRTSTTDPSSLCTILVNRSNCPQDPKTGWEVYHYQSNASGTSYVLWARMERQASSSISEYYILCSGGQAGIRAGALTVAGGNCPI